MGLKDKLLQEKIKSMEQLDRIEMNQYVNIFEFKKATLCVMLFISSMSLIKILINMQNALEYSLRESFTNNYIGGLFVIFITIILLVSFLYGKRKADKQIEQFIEDKTK